jgi:hypothetical protein
MRVISAQTMRVIVGTIGTLMTAVYVYRYWL